MKHLFTLLFIFIGFQLLANTTIKGKAIDKETGEPLIGAVVFLDNKNYSAVVGLDGSYSIKDVLKGNYKIKCQYIGYTTLEQNITVADEGILSLNLELEEKKNELIEVVVTGVKNTEDENHLRKLEQNSNQVVNMVSARSIEISPDLTVANVIQRVSGVSIERNSNGDGQYAILRGMDKRYNYTLINGIKIPSPDNKYRYVPLDIFPSDLVGRLEIFKSLTPDMEGDAVGGVVNIVMKDAPGELMVKANLAGGYNELFMQRNFISFDYKQIDFKSPYESNGNTYNANNNDFSKGTITYKEKPPIPNMVGGLAIGNRFFNNRLGIVVASSFQNTYRGSNSDFFNADVYADEKYARISSLSERRFSERQARLGLHSKIDFKLDHKNKFQLYNAYLSLENDQIRDAKKIDFSSGYDSLNGSNASLTYSTRARLTKQTIYNSTLQGIHLFWKKIKINWSAVYSIAKNQVPDNTTVNIYGTRKNFVETRTTPSSNSRRWEHNSDQDLAGYLNFTYLNALGNENLEISFGGLYRDKKRDNFYNNYTFVPANPNATYGVDFTNNNQISWILNNPRGSVASALTYKASEKISSGYLMSKFNYAGLQIIAGVRAEHTDQGYQMLYPLGESRPVGTQVYMDVLPSINAKYSPVTNTNFRVSYFRSLNRPGFSEIVPGKITNEEYNERGNADLQRAVADNIDLRYELFPNKTDQFMFGVFYKYIKNPIEYTLVADSTRGQDIFYTPGNFGNATNYGLELDYIKYFRNFGIKANYTFTKSSITTKKTIRVRDEKGNLSPLNVEQTRPLYGQSQHVANLSFLYKNSRSGWDGQLAGSYTGERINTVSQFLNNDLWQTPFVQMDASIEKKINQHWVIFAKANNLFNTPLKVYIKGTNPVNANIPDQDNTKGRTLIRQDYYQRSYLIGVRYLL